MKRRFTVWTVVIVICMGGAFLTRCSKSSKSTVNQIRGTVTLEGETDHGGVTVKLFSPPEVQHDLVFIQSSHPGLGVPLNLQMVFDRRLANFIASTQTNGDGLYRFTEIPSGDYIVMADMDGYGYQGQYDISVHSGNEFAVDRIDLLKEAQLAGALENSRVLDADRHYIVSGDVTVPPGMTLTIEPGAHIEFDGYYTLLIEGRLEAIGTEAEIIYFTSHQQMPSKDDWKRIEFSSSSETSQIRWCVVEYSTNGIYGKSTPLLLSHNMIRYNTENGILIFSTFDTSIEIKNHLIMDSKKGLWLEHADNSTIENNILFENQELGIGCQESSPVLENNLLQANKYGLYAVYNSNPQCRNNALMSNEWGLVCGGYSNPLLNLCSFTDHSIGAIYIFQPPRGSQAQPTVHSSNFDEHIGLIRIDGGPQAPNNLTIDATNNYWGDLSTGEIDRLIWDKQDVLPETAPYVAQVDYLPLATTLIDSAGLQ